MNTQTNWLTIKQAAQKLDMAPKSLHDWLRKHAEVRDQYVTKLGSRELTGRQCSLINENGIVFIASMRGNFQGNAKRLGHQDFSEGKRKIVETALSNIQQESLMLQTARILEQLNTRIERLEKNLISERKEPKQLEAPRTFDALRPLLNIRVNEYAKKTGAEHRNLWNILYYQFFKQTGIDLKAIATGRGVEPLDVAQQDGHLLNLYNLSAQLYRVHESVR